MVPRIVVLAGRSKSNKIKIIISIIYDYLFDCGCEVL